MNSLLLVLVYIFKGPSNKPISWGWSIAPIYGDFGDGLSLWHWVYDINSRLITIEYYSSLSTA